MTHHVVLVLGNQPCLQLLSYHAPTFFHTECESFITL